MNKTSSNKQMENQLNQLGTLKRLEPNENLFDSINSKIRNYKKETISWAWLRTAAAITICIFSIEFFTIKSESSSSNSIESLVPISNNTLYND